MNLIVYTTLANDTSQQLINILAKVAQWGKKELFNTINRLTHRLTQIPKDSTIVILLITNNKELSFVLSLHQFFENFKLILILPDRRIQTMSKGHGLCPRYVSYSDSDFSDVGAVLEKMIDNIRDGGRTRFQLSGSTETEKPEGCLS